MCCFGAGTFGSKEIFETGAGAFFQKWIDWGVEEKSSSGKKFEFPKKSNFFPLNFFGSYGSRGATTMADHSF